MTTAMEPSRVERSIARTLSGIAHVLESDSETEGRIRDVLEQLHQLMPYDGCALLAADVEGAEMLTVVPNAQAYGVEQLRQELRRFWDLLSEGGDVHAATPRSAAVTSRPWRSQLAVPLVGLDQIVGVLTVGHDSPNAYDERDLELLAIVGAQIASYLTAVHTRKHELAEEKLAREHVEDQRRRLLAFFSMLSHELRNPLATVHSAAEILRMRQGDASLNQQALDIIDQQVHTLTRLVDDLLDASRVTAGKVELRRADVDLNALARLVADMSRPRFTERRQELSVALAGAPLWVRADRTRLEQVLVNLLTNAAKYTQEGGRIGLSVAEESGQAVIRVRDTGIGIPASLLPQLFELFVQGDQAGDRRQRGLGVGLALVKTLVEMHGGTVSAASEGPGKGSEFVVRIPLLSAKEGPRPA